MNETSSSVKLAAQEAALAPVGGMNCQWMAVNRAASTTDTGAPPVRSEKWTLVVPATTGWNHGVGRSPARPPRSCSTPGPVHYYFDRTFTIASLSAPLLGGVLIETANDDKGVSVSNHLQFTPNQAVTVYVAMDKRTTTLPAWIDSGLASDHGNFHEQWRYG